MSNGNKYPAYVCVQPCRHCLPIIYITASNVCERSDRRTARIMLRNIRRVRHKCAARKTQQFSREKREVQLGDFVADVVRNKLRKTNPAKIVGTRCAKLSMKKGGRLSGRDRTIRNASELRHRLHEARCAVVLWRVKEKPSGWNFDRIILSCGHQRGSYSKAAIAQHNQPMARYRRAPHVSAHKK